MRIKTSDFETCKAIKEAFDQGTPFEFMGRQWLGTALQIDPRSIDLGPEFTVDAHILQEVKSAPAVWNGPEEGLPPVGLEVEVLWSSTPVQYVTCKILGHDEGRAVYRFTSGGRKGEYGAGMIYFGSPPNMFPNFRPIRTAEQLAAEEREQQIAMISAVISQGFRECKKLADVLYDAGARMPGEGSKS